MHASSTLYQPEHHIAFPKYSGAHFPAMIASEVLLIYGGSGQGQFSRFFQQINIILLASRTLVSVYWVTLGESCSMSAGNTASAPYTRKNGV